MLTSTFTFKTRKDCAAARIILGNSGFTVWDGSTDTKLVTGGGDTGEQAEDVLFLANFDFEREDGAV